MLIAGRKRKQRDALCRVHQWRHSRLPAILICSFVAGTLSAVPKIECDAPKHSFGTKISGDAITHQFILWNRGDEPLEIVKIKNCCGVESKVVPSLIAPGSNAVCTCVFTTKNRSGEQDKQILLVTNDKKNLYFDLRLSGTLLNPIEFAPRWVRLDSMLTDSTISETITATNLLEEVVTLDSVAVRQEGLAVEIIESGERSWKIKLTSSSALVSGQLNTRVILNFSTGPVEVPVVGTIRPVIQASPGSIRLGCASSSDVERLVMLRSGDDRAFDVLSATLENAEGSVSTERLADGKWKIKISLKTQSVGEHSVLHIRTALASQESIRIPLMVK